MARFRHTKNTTYICLLGLITLSSQFFGIAPSRATETWKKVPVEVASEIANSDCFVKIGTPYVFNPYSPGLEAWQGLKTWFAPSLASKQKVMTIYPMDQITAESWHKISQELNQNSSTKVAIFTELSSNQSGEMVGVPVKWEDGLADSFKNILDNDGRKSEFISEQTREIFYKSYQLKFHNEYSSALKDNWKFFNDPKVGQRMPYMYQFKGNPKSFFIGFSIPPSYLSHSSNIPAQGKVILNKGAFGENLGYTIDAWPSDKSDTDQNEVIREAPPGCRTDLIPLNAKLDQSSSLSEVDEALTSFVRKHSDPCWVLETLPEKRVRHIANIAFRSKFGGESTIITQHSDWASSGSPSVEREIRENSANADLKTKRMKAMCSFVTTYEVDKTNSKSGKDSSAFVSMVTKDDSGNPTVTNMVAILR